MLESFGMQALVPLQLPDFACSAAVCWPALEFQYLFRFACNFVIAILCALLLVASELRLLST